MKSYIFYKHHENDQNPFHVQCLQVFMNYIIVDSCFFLNKTEAMDPKKIGAIILGGKESVTHIYYGSENIFCKYRYVIHPIFYICRDNCKYKFWAKLVFVR